MSDNRDTPQSGDHPGGSSVVADSVGTTQVDTDTGAAAVIGATATDDAEQGGVGDVHAPAAGDTADAGEVGEAEVDHTTEPDMSLDYQQQQEHREAGMAVMDAMGAMDDLDGMGAMEDGMDEGMELDFGSGGIDQATLANLAALSRIGGGDDDEEGEGEGEIDLSAFLNADMGEGGPAEEEEDGQAAPEEQAEPAQGALEQSLEDPAEGTTMGTSGQDGTRRDEQTVRETPQQEAARPSEDGEQPVPRDDKEAPGGGAPDTAVQTTEQAELATSTKTPQAGEVAPSAPTVTIAPVPAPGANRQPNEATNAESAPPVARSAPSTAGPTPATRPQITDIDIDPSLRPPQQPQPRRDSAAAAAAAEEADRSEVQAQLRRFFATNPDAIGAGRRADGLDGLNGSGGLDTGTTASPADQNGQLRNDGRGGDEGSGADEHEHGEDDSDDADFTGPRYVYENGRLKRKRNRTVLSCTECHRRCDRKIPCSRCVKRGVGSMCRMEMPNAAPEKKKRKVVKETPIDYELNVRVQALESLIRSGSTLDHSSASTAAMETILHATRAAESGSQDASSALAQLTEAMSGGGIGNMSQDAQSSLLMDVLQQLSTASMSKPPEGGEPEGEKVDLWASVPEARGDSVTDIAKAFDDDEAPTKLNLSVTGFREDSGRIFVPPSVRYAEKQMKAESVLADQVLPAWGDERFLDAGVKFAYGTEANGRYQPELVSAIQTISLTGALRMAGSFVSRFPTIGRYVYLPSPTPEDHTRTLRESGLEIRTFRYVDKKTGSVDIDGLREDLLLAPERSAVLLWVAGSAPTGVDPTESQWKVILNVCRQRSLIPLVIMAFQGLCSGDPAKDAEPLRLMASEGLPVVLCQTFDAMMGLYADSPSIVSVMTQSEEAKTHVDSQLRSTARGLYLHPSPWGAIVARMILTEPRINTAWKAELKAMADRLKSVREKLYDLLANKFKTPGTWDHIRQTAGLYCTTLLQPPINENLTSKRHIHLLPYGCFSLGCLNAAKIEALARSIDSVVLAAQREAEEAQAAQLAMQLALEAAREAAAREEAEAEAQAAREEDRRILEMDLQTAIEAQRLEEEDEERREEEERGLEEAVRKAAERAETARQAEAILASITAAGF